MKYTLLILLLTLSVTAVLHAQETVDPHTAFKNTGIVMTPEIVVPTVVAVPLPELFLTRQSFLITERLSGELVPWYFKQTYTKEPAVFSATASLPGRAAHLVDDDPRTSVDFTLPEDRRGEVTIILRSDTPVTASAVHLDLAQNVALPLTVEVRALESAGGEQIVVAESRLNGERVNFPQITSTAWEISLTYGQLLRINELKLIEDDVESSVDRSVRFLAQPGSDYVIYLNPDRNVSAVTSEAGNLMSDEGVLTLPTLEVTSNPLYVQADVDNDSVVDVFDNCVSVPNTDQIDVDQNGRGDACDDFDRDGRINSQDNCPNNPNRAQEDEDGDGMGDACDAEESRFTERYVWVPWVGMGMAGVVILGLFVLVARGPKPEERTDAKSDTPTEGHNGF